MNLRSELHQGTAILHLEGEFNFAHHQAFKDAAYPLLAKPEIQVVHLNLSAVTHMDSSSLGMLLVLLQKARDAGKSLRLINPSPEATLILKAVQFGRMFDIVNG